MHAFAECSNCHRHVRPGADACPFCGDAAPSVVDRPKPSRRLSRSAMLRYGAAVSATLAIGCADDRDGETDAGDVGGFDSGTSGSDAGVSSDDAGFDAGFDAGEIAMPYGAPPLRDVLV